MAVNASQVLSSLFNVDDNVCIRVFSDRRNKDRCAMRKVPDDGENTHVGNSVRLANAFLSG